MAKKKFKKKKNKQHKNLNQKQRIDNFSAVEIENPNAEVKIVDTEKESIKTESAKDNDAVIDKKESITLDKEYAYVRKDVKKILIILSSIVILMVVIYFINQKTSFLQPVADWIYQVLNIKTQ